MIICASCGEQVHPDGNKWIKCEDELPEDKKMVLIVATNKGPKGDYTTDMYTGWHDSEQGWIRWAHKFEPTHWQPLPKEPES